MCAMHLLLAVIGVSLWLGEAFLRGNGQKKTYVVKCPFCHAEKKFGSRPDEGDEVCEGSTTKPHSPTKMERVRDP